MRSCSSASSQLGAPPGASPAPRAAVLEAAVDFLMIRKDFKAALEACEEGLEGEREARCDDLKASLCILGIQALAELNQWYDVLPWVLQHYGKTEKVPAKIMQMCILLYTKVAEQAEVQEAARVWLHCSGNMSQSGYSSVAELYLLHVLLPLGQTTMAIQLLEEEVGQTAFTEEQRQTALAIVETHGSKRAPTSYPSPRPVSVEASTRGRMSTAQGSLVQRMGAVLSMLYRGISVARTSIQSGAFRQALLLVLLLCLLLVRKDPALPSAYSSILKLYGLFQQMWNTMFGPYYRAFSQN